MMIAGGLAALVLRWRLLLQAFKGLRDASLSSDEFPLPWVIGGVVVLSIAFCVIQQAFFGLPLWMSALGVLASVPLMLVGLRALGETNFGANRGALQPDAGRSSRWSRPAISTANIPGNAATGSIAVTSEGLIQDYKAGHLIGSTPRSMTIAQLIAAPIGSGALALTYPALVKTYGLIGEHAQLAARRACGGRRPSPSCSAPASARCRPRRCGRC